MLPSLIDVLTHNQHYDYPQKIFELGEVVMLDPKEETGTRNVRKLACVIADTKAGYEDISSALDVIMKNLGVDYALKAVDHKSFIPGRVAEVIVGKKSKSIGFVGELSPVVLRNWKLEMPVAAFEMGFEELS